MILDDFHVLEECRETAGRRIFPAEGDSGPTQSTGIRVGIAAIGRRAGLSQAPAGVVVRGSRPAFRRGSPCRLECQLDWTIPAGFDAELEIDLSRGWLPDRSRSEVWNDPVDLASVGAAVRRHEAPRGAAGDRARQKGAAC